MNFLQLMKNVFKTKNDEQDMVKEAVIIDEKKAEIIFSPLSGDIVKLSEVSDPTFAQEMMGKGIAIEPLSNVVVSPVNGVVVAIFKTKHAIALRSDNGAEILIHIGIDTVELEGRHFAAYVRQDDRVKIGEELVEFNLEQIKREGYDVVTSIIITNTDCYSDIKATNMKKIKERESLIEVIV